MQEKSEKVIFHWRKFRDHSEVSIISLESFWHPWTKGQLISKAIYGLLTSPKKRLKEFVFLSWRLGNTWNLNFDFKFQVFLSCQFVFWEKLRLDNFVSRSTDLYQQKNLRYVSDINLFFQFSIEYCNAYWWSVCLGKIVKSLVTFWVSSWIS